MPDIQDELRRISLRIAHYKQEALAEKDDIARNIIDKNIEELEKEATKLRNSTGTEAVGANKKTSPDFDKYVPGEKEAIEAFKRSGRAPLRVAQEVKKAVVPPTKTKEQKENDKLLTALRKSVQPVPQRPIFRASGFSLPQFTSDNSTSIVLACVLIIFFLELHAGTKFVALWNDAFSPATKSSGSGPGISQNHSGLKPPPIREDRSQNLEGLNTPVLETFSGAGLRDYGVPESFHYLEGAIW